MRNIFVTPLLNRACFPVKRYALTFITRCLSRSNSGKWNNVTATKRLKQLQSSVDANQEHNDLLMIEAITICNNVSEPINYYSINTMLKLCLCLHRPETALSTSFWDLIKSTDGVSLLLVMRCCIASGDISKAIEVLQWMQQLQFRPRNEFELKEFRSMISKLLTLCGESDAINFCSSIETIHSLLQCHDDDIFIQTAMINAFAKRCHITKSLDIFSSIPSTTVDAVCLNSMMRICIEHKMHSKAVSLYNDHSRITLINDTSHLLVIDACTQCDDFESGKQIIDGLLSSHSLLPNRRVLRAIFEFYGHFGAFKDAEHLFHRLLNCGIAKTVQWMMKMYVNHSEYEQAMNLYDAHCHSESRNDNDALHNFAIKCCAKLQDYDRGRDIIVKLDPFQSIGKDEDRNIELKNTVIDFYCHFGDLDKAERIFNDIPDDEKTISTLNIMMAGYCNHCNQSRFENALQIFKNLDTVHIALRGKASVLTYALALKACTQGTALHFGMEIEERLKREGMEWMLMESDIAVNMINLYGRGGMVERAEEVFTKTKRVMEERGNDVRIWNAMLNAYGRNGRLLDAIKLFDSMESVDGLKKDIATMINVFCACSHGGEAERALEIWKSLVAVDGGLDIKYNRNVVTSIVDGLAKKGLLREARMIVIEYLECRKLQNEDDRSLWMALLSASRKSKDDRLHDEIYREMQARCSLEHLNSSV